MTTTQKPLIGTYSPGSIHMVGNGFHVRNLFPSNDLGEHLSPFLLLDYAGPSTYGPTQEPRGVGEHPHRGFETVTICYQGRIAHRDSAGHSGVIGPGDVQWMTAGSGVVHEEMHEKDFAAAGGTLQMVQLWVNLPKAHKMTSPKYQDITKDRIPVVEVGGARVRVIAGEFQGQRGPAETFSPLNVWDVQVPAGERLEFELPAGQNAGWVVLDGATSVNGSESVSDAQMAWLDPEGRSVQVQAEADTRAVFLSGEPLGDPVVSHGPFVMTSQAEIVQAIRDYQSGKMGHLS